MGLFLETAVIPDTREEKVRAALEELARRFPDLKTAECQFKEQNGGVSVLFNEYCAGYEDFAKELSAQLNSLVLYLYIYDEDFWGCYLCENGQLLDEFNPMPDYFEEISDAERQRVAGNSALIAERFHVPEADIKRYFLPWTEEILDAPEPQKAYEDDQCSIGDCWQMIWFMEKLGYPYPWE